eukprot:TRINITY_DN11378_c1_g2_i3.p1 TRINITY_DN11378_c1_g2~~TRINITY_DN11378_c1_g2_i3.p1  ORF type:complete len:315 (+),score=71.71 TRINITY_DN11378_c1_g2_i3:79-1023(+)
MPRGQGRAGSGGKLAGGDFEDEYTAVGEEYDEVEAEDEDEEEARVAREQQLLQEACLPVSGAPMDPSEGAPQDADEYLRQVQWERLRCPEVVSVEVEEKPARRSKNKDRKGPLSGGLLAFFNCPEIPAELQYNEDWANDAAEAYRALRSQCMKTRKATPAARASQLTYEEWRRHVDRDAPAMELLGTQDFVSINHLMVVSVDRMEAVYEGLLDSSGTSNNGTSEGGSAPSKAIELDADRLDALVEWTFTSMAFVEEPLVDDIQYQMQRLRRACQRLLALVHEKAATHNDKTLVTHVQTRICLLLVLIKNVFGQQ